MACSGDCEVEQVVLALLALVELANALGDGFEVLLDLSFVAVCAEFLQGSFLLQTLPTHLPTEESAYR